MIPTFVMDTLEFGLTAAVRGAAKEDARRSSLPRRPSPSPPYSTLFSLLLTPLQYPAVLVARQGRILYEHGFGLANLHWNILNDAQTEFEIGSMTKQSTASDFAVCQ